MQVKKNQSGQISLVPCGPLGHHLCKGGFTGVNSKGLVHSYDSVADNNHKRQNTTFLVPVSIFIKS